MGFLRPIIDAFRPGEDKIPAPAQRVSSKSLDAARRRPYEESGGRRESSSSSASSCWCLG